MMVVPIRDSERMTLMQNDEFTETTLEAMRKAQLTSLTAQIGLEEYASLRTRGIEPKILYSKSHGYRVRDPSRFHRPLNS
jgi:hypothetical protein